MQRIHQRTTYDLEMMREIGFCKGIENYSRHFSRRLPGDPPPCLLDYFPQDFLLFIDESHQTLPQIHAMYNGDRARKESLIEFGFRLPSAFDNRPLKFEEVYRRIHQVIYVSATPGQLGSPGSPWRRRPADHPSHRPSRSRDRNQARRSPGGRLPRADPHWRQKKGDASSSPR